MPAWRAPTRQAATPRIGRAFYWSYFLPARRTAHLALGLWVLPRRPTIRLRKSLTLAQNRTIRLPVGVIRFSKIAGRRQTGWPHRWQFARGSASRQSPLFHGPI